MNRSLLIIAIIISCSCGGGTSGTSDTGVRTQKVIIGSITKEDGEPVEDAEITLEDTGQSTRSGQFGGFSFSADLAKKNSKLNVQSKTSSQTIELPNLSEDTSILRLDIKISKDSVSYQDLEFSLNSIYGNNCEGAFDKLEIFQLSQNSSPLLLSNQILPIKANVKCFASLQLSSRGLPAANIGVQMYLIQTPSSIAQSLSAVLLSERSTDNNGQVIFEFKPNLPVHRPGYFVIEAPSIRQSDERLAVVINPLRTE